MVPRCTQKSRANRNTCKKQGSVAGVGIVISALSTTIGDKVHYTFGFKSLLNIPRAISGYYSSYI